MLVAKFLVGYEEVRFEAASILAKIHLEQVILFMAQCKVHVTLVELIIGVNSSC